LSRIDPRILGILYGLGAALIWGAWAPAARLGVTGALDSWDLVALRFGVSTVILLPFLMRQRIGLGGVAAVPWSVILAMAVTAGAPYMLLMFVGFQFAPAGHQAILGPAIGMIVRFALARFVLKERIGPLELIGGGIMFGGLFVAGWEVLTSGPGLNIGHVLFVLGAFLWSFYVVIARAWRIGATVATAILAVFSGVIYVPIYLAVFGLRVLAAPWQEVVLQTLFHGVLSGILSMILFTRCLILMGVAQATVFSAAVPALATMIAWPLLGEAPTWLQALGVALVTAGMLVAVAGGLGPGRAAATASGQTAGIVPGSRP
jgi:drug/metabolite transporter (DMT)-like permease